MSQGACRKISARRGSVSAPDPLGKNAALNHDPNRSSSSTLTIVRVVDPASPSSTDPSSSDSPSSPTLGRRSFRRHGTISSAPSADNRLSFAFSSFSPISPSQPSSPLSSSGPQNYPSRSGSSPSSSPRLRPSSPQFVRRNSGSGGSAYSKPNFTPEQLVDLARQSSAPRYVPGPNPNIISNTSHSDHTVSTTSSAKFTILPDDVYLPFIDRAAEASQLLSTPPTKKLFSLLAQTFPTQATHDEKQDMFTVDPARWSFNTLRRWLTEVDRSCVSDAVWVKQARKCVLAHSELIWERLKGALGVPPELELGELDAYQPIGSDVAPDLSILSYEQNSGSLDTSQPSLDSIPSEPASSPEQSIVIEPILATPSSHPPHSASGSNPPPSSLPVGLSQSTSKGQVDQVLQDIVEDREEDEDVVADVGDENRSKSEDGSKAQIHGIRVCTSPVPSSSTVAQHMFSTPPSPDVGVNLSGRNSVEPRSPDLSHYPMTHRLSRASSRGSITSAGRPLSGIYAYRELGYSAASSEIGDSESERAYDPVGDRVPGNPLFPSNFARLAVGPTLRANNPSLRSPHTIPTRWRRWAPGSRPPSWIESWDPVKHEYAATVASGSSIGAGEYQ